MQLPVVYLKPVKEQSLKRFHPWIFSGAIKNVNAELEEGDLVRVHDSHDNFLAIGHYQIGSIAVRVLSFKDETIDDAFWQRKIRVAYEIRAAMGLTSSETTNAFRLVHGEGDGLPGLIVDVYDQTAVVQMHTVGMYRCRNVLADALKDVFGDKLTAIYDKSEGTLPFKANVQPENGFLWGKSTSHIAKENGLLFQADWEKGQKTGFFVDQRENRALLEKYSANRKVLNMFCYTGGFSFYAMRGGAKMVHSVDSSERAVELTNQNVELNFPGDIRHSSFAVDAFKFMESAKEKYDLMVLDPPAFAKHLKVIKNALQGYKRLNAKAIEMIAPGGILFTFSCSQVISKEAFRTMVFSAAARSGRNVRILHQLDQPADHPVSIYHPEGEYLKGLVLYVE
ncbi:class I SAM-dependent rRNA methyltransferase [Alkalitalea saponilacus]|uniref:23S rRNA (Cytosine1962-C5)-methyltransferase n=1 Tax=Alkalitalea saponilacus TaxID=889453 RepID=A0A1T5HL27_9BACT|nr:class I SAM-dependent rRNA methyltransferase [Alkalitalea saponilacus]ASB47803.1 RlmI/RlmK family 23S rRNA methyltransferase [Alkalitalea saponilacus]SKC21367.1 23S rRNA (cytosine1962-C5)-methyltransferase [Alkalitalea saponilacus]